MIHPAQRCYFSDGTPLTANDVKYTFTRMLALPDSVQTDYGSAIAGAEAVMDGTATDLEGIQVIDDTHFTVTLSDPFAGSCMSWQPLPAPS